MVDCEADVVVHLGQRAAAVRGVEGRFLQGLEPGAAGGLGLGEDVRGGQQRLPDERGVALAEDDGVPVAALRRSPACLLPAVAGRPAAGPWARVRLSPARDGLAGGGGRLVGEDRGEVAVGEPALRQRPARAPGPPARVPCRAAIWTARVILDRTREAPAAAASASQSPAPSPMDEELRLRRGAGLRLAVQRPGRGGRVVRRLQPRAARRGGQVAGHLGRALPGRRG